MGDMVTGNCEGCKKRKVRLWPFVNDLTVDPPIRFNLCSECYQKAMKCVMFAYGQQRGRMLKNDKN